MHVLVQAFAPDSIHSTLILVYWEFEALLLACAITVDLCFAEDSSAICPASSFCHSCITTQQIVSGSSSSTVEVTH